MFCALGLRFLLRKLMRLQLRITCYAHGPFVHV